MHQGKFKSIPADDPDGVLTIGLNRAVDLLAQQSKGRGGGGFGTLKELGAHPEDGKPVNISKGRFGPYIRHGGVNATIPKSVPVEEVTLAQAIEWLSAKKGGGGTKAKAKPKSKTKKAKEA